METQNQNIQNPQPQRVIVQSTKSVGTSALLAFLFGPLGLFYSTVTGGLVMLVVSFVVGFFTLGFGLLITWPACIVWAIIAANSYNKKLTGGI